MTVSLALANSVTSLASTNGLYEQAKSTEPVVGESMAPSQEKNVNYDFNPIPRVSQAKNLTLPGGQGTLTSNTWRGSAVTSGNTYQWDYQVSAVYSGSGKVTEIKTAWRGSASLRNSGSVSLGITGSGGSASASSSWQTVNTVEKYWSNTNGAKTADYRSNMIVTPSKDYRSGTVSTTNTAYVKLSGDAKTYQISSGV